MKKTISLLAMIVFLSASCNFFQKQAAAGLAKTTNGGADWKFSNTIKGSTSVTLGAVNISKIGFDPQNREIVFAASYTDGLFKSEDSGETWTKILSKIGVYDFAIHAQDSKIIYAAGLYGGFGKVLKTIDSGKSWVEIFNQQGEANAVRSVVINPQNPNQILVGTNSGSVVKSADSGLSWMLAKDFQDRVQRIFWQNGEIFVLLRAKGLYRAKDFAGNFDNLTPKLAKMLDMGDFSYNANAVETFNQMYVDYFTNNLIYLTTDKGLYKSTDEGSNWQLMPLPVDKNNANARAIAIAKSSSNIVYASIGATSYKSVDGGNTWQTQSIPTTGFINYILVDPVLAQIAYAGMYVSE